MAMLEHLMELQNLFIVEGMHLYPFLTHLKKRRELRKEDSTFIFQIDGEGISGGLIIYTSVSYVPLQ